MWRWPQGLPIGGIYSKDCVNVDSCILKIVFPKGCRKREDLYVQITQLSLDLKEAWGVSSSTLWCPMESRSAASHKHQPSCRSTSSTYAHFPPSLHQGRVVWMRPPPPEQRGKRSCQEWATGHLIWSSGTMDQKLSTPNVMGIPVFCC